MPDPVTERLRERMLRRFGFIWMIIVFFILIKFWWIQEMLVVCWVYGWDGYAVKGIRVIATHKPNVFSNGSSIPDLPDAVTGFAYFILVVGGLIVLPTIILNLLDRRSPSTPAQSPRS